MKFQIDAQGRLFISVTRKEQRSLKAAQRCEERSQCVPPFDTDAFLHDLFEPVVSNSEYTWLPEGFTGDLTSAPMLGILGDETPGPDDAQDAAGMGLLPIGQWPHEGHLRHMYRPVLKRWAFMAYQVTSPQRELADTGECVWDGGDLWDVRGPNGQAAGHDGRSVLVAPHG